MDSEQASGQKEQQQDKLKLKTKSIFSALASIPSVISARFISRTTYTTLQLDYSITHHPRLCKVKATQSIQLQEQHAPIINSLQFIDPQILHQSLSPTGTKLAIFRLSHDPQADHSSASDRAKPQLYIEIWDTTVNALLGSYDLTSAHHAFILNSTFGHPSWDSSETCLAYVAESNQPESASWLERNRYRPDFGEQLTEIHSPGIFILSIGDCHASITDPDPSQPPRIIQLIDPSDSNYSSALVYGQPVFGHQSGQQESNHHQIFCTGFASLPDHRRLGLIYCQNRPSAIFEFKFKIPPTNDKQLEEKPIKLAHPIHLSCTRVSDLFQSARSPYVVDDHSLIYLSNPIGGPHASCASLNLYNHQSRQHKLLVGPVDEPLPESPHDFNPFPGLYLDQIPSSVKLIDPSDFKKSIILISSISGSKKVPVTIELDSATLISHCPPHEYSATLLCTDGQLQALFTISNTTLPPQLWIATLSRERGLHFSWKMIGELTPSATLQSQLSKLESRVIKLPMNDMGPTEIVLTTPKLEILDRIGSRKSSLIIVPHGGPHSTSINEFSPSTASMALLGYSTAYINYPGSLGFGQRWVSELPRNLGITDVESCKLALEHLISLDLIKELQVDDRIFISGGSHGGFITAHLTSRYPDLFRAACMRNPVVDLVGTASGGSDIPDWSYAEVNINFPSLNPTESQQDGKISVNEIDFKILRDKSPIKFINNVKTPTLMLLGSQDRRVSHQQGLAWYHGIKNLKNVTTELIMFDKDSHPLSSVVGELNSFMIWFEFLSAYSHKIK